MSSFLLGLVIGVFGGMLAMALVRMGDDLDD